VFAAATDAGRSPLEIGGVPARRRPGLSSRAGRCQVRLRRVSHANELMAQTLIGPNTAAARDGRDRRCSRREQAQFTAKKI
jgi:hypothetical protein